MDPGIHDPGSEVIGLDSDPGSRTASPGRLPSSGILPSFPYCCFLVQFLMLVLNFFIRRSENGGS